MPTKRKKRRTSTGKSGEAVLKEYNHRCAMCAADRPQIHHIDEDPSNQDPLNLLPLCPNCHLSDQHNPTTTVDARLLRLFRIHKDPTILSPQFLPLFRRMLFLYEPEGQTHQQLSAARKDLVSFVAALEMGSFYSSRLTQFLKARAVSAPVKWFDRRNQPAVREQVKKQALAEYRRHLAASREQVHELMVEMLRYQSWRQGK